MKLTGQNKYLVGEPTALGGERWPATGISGSLGKPQVLQSEICEFVLE